MSTPSNTMALSQQELQAISHEAFMCKADKVNNILYKLALGAVCLAILGLLFFSPAAFAQASGGMDEAEKKLTGFLSGVKKILGPISILVVTIAMSMISGKLGEDKQNKQEKSETAIRERIGVVPLALPLMAGPGAISSTIVWGTRYHNWVHLIGFSVAIAIFALCCWGVFRMAPWLVRLLGQTGINVITRIMGLLLMALGIEFIVTGIKSIFPGLLH